MALVRRESGGPAPWGPETLLPDRFQAAVLHPPAQFGRVVGTPHTPAATRYPDLGGLVAQARTRVTARKARCKHDVC